MSLLDSLSCFVKKANCSANGGSAPDVYSLFQISWVFLLFGFLLLGLWRLLNWCDDHSKPIWWVPYQNDANSSPTPRDIVKIINTDPLDLEGDVWPARRRLGVKAFALVFLFFGIGLIFTWAVALILISDGVSDIPRSLPYFGIFPFLLAAVGLGLNIRRNVQSKNRMEWINSLRQHIADAISRAPVMKTSGDVKRSEIFLDNNPQHHQPRVLVETFLNPSERDHRTLAMLLRWLYRVRIDELDRPVIEFIQDASYKDSDIEYDAVGGCLEDMKFAPQRHRDKMISWSIRLTNAILKREWERVKRAA